MSAKKPRAPRDNGHFGQNIFITILLVIIVIQSLLLAKVYFKEPHATVRTGKLTPHVIKPKTKPLARILPQEQIPVPPPVTTGIVKEVSPGAGKIVVIVDDSGYNPGQDCRYLNEIQVPVTISILPELEHSGTIARCANKANKEVMLHLPLEPHHNDEKYPENYIINTSMSAGMVVDHFNQDLASVPFVTGINNHMGSKATEDIRLMSIIFSQLLKHDLFFVDSRVTSQSVCRRLALRKGLAFAERDVFLDNKNERAAIETQYQELAQKARERGYAVAIGHARPLSWEILKEETEKLSREGFQFITVRELLKEKK